MNNKHIKYILLILTVFITCTMSVKGDISSNSSGAASGSGMTQGGNWYTSYVGLKISIVDSNNNLEDVEIILNSSGEGGSKFSASNLPKTKQDYTITWLDADEVTTYTSDNLPSSWRNSSNKNINIYDMLEDNNYDLLKKLLDKKSNGNKIFSTKSEGDYILIEPMVKIGSEYGTAFELLNAFVSNVQNCTESGNPFCHNYTLQVFGGNTNDENGGLLWNTLYVDETTSAVNLYTKTKWYSNRIEKDANYFSGYNTPQKQNKCLKAKTCGRGIGVFKYDDIYDDDPPKAKLRIVKLDNNRNYLAGAGFTLYSSANCSNSKIVREQKIDIDGNGIVTFKLTPGTYYYKETKVPVGYTGDTSCKRVDVTLNGDNGDGITRKEVINSQKPGLLKIYKLNTSNVPISFSSAYFKIFYNSNCVETNAIESLKKVEVKGYREISLLPGTYSIKEIIPPDGYVVDAIDCKNFTISADTNTESKFKNKSECEIDLETKQADGSYTAADAFMLYKKYSDKGKKYNSLLNLKDPQCAAVTCTPDLNTSCLAGTSKNDNWNDTNFACFDKTLTNGFGTVLGFCKKTFNQSNKTGKTSFSGTLGKFILNKADFEGITTHAQSINTCYVLDTVLPIEFTTYSYDINGNIQEENQGYMAPGMEEPSDFQIYFGDNDGNRNPDELTTYREANNASVISKSYGVNKYEWTKNKYFLLNEVYFEKLTGRVTLSKSSTTTVTPIRGIVLPFNYNFLNQFGQTVGIIPAKFSWNGYDKNNSCQYYASPEIITYNGPTDPNGKINLEFRTIDTSNPFSGKNGGTRQTGSNWCPVPQNCSGEPTENQLIINTITDKNNSYNSKGTGAIYTIELTPDTIKDIRNYNKNPDNKKYDEYNVTCDNKGNCVNAFLSRFNITKTG